MRSSQILGAVYHESLANDMEVLHSPELIRRLTALVRQVKPDVVLALSLEDYMEDHMNSARLAVTASFLRGVPNYHSFPPEPPVFKDVMVYHSTPHTLTDQIRRPIIPELFVDISAMIEEKERMLSCHESQREWLDKSQGFGSYLATMRQIGEKLGLLSGRFLYAEGWRRHCHVGFSRVDANPLAELLADFCHMPTSG
jgi:LmbE family N-acetylglucosaminyl deacetylase